VDAGAYTERNVRSTLTCDFNDLQKNSRLQTGQKKIFFLLDGCLYLQYTSSCTAHWQNVASCLPSSFRQIWVGFWGNHTVYVGEYVSPDSNLGYVTDFHEHLYQHYEDAKHPQTFLPIFSIQQCSGRIQFRFNSRQLHLLLALPSCIIM